MVCSTSPDRLISAMSSRTATITTTPSAHRRPVLSPSLPTPIISSCLPDQRAQNRTSPLASTQALPGRRRARDVHLMADAGRVGVARRDPHPRPRPVRSARTWPPGEVTS